MSKIRTVHNRTTNQEETLTSGQIRKIRKAERQARLGGIQPDFRNHLPYDLDSINRMFFFLKPLKAEDLKMPFVGHYSAEQNAPNPALDGTPVIEPTTSSTEDAKPKKTRKPAVKKTAKAPKAKKTAVPTT